MMFAVHLTLKSIQWALHREKLLHVHQAAPWEHRFGQKQQNNYSQSLRLC